MKIVYHILAVLVLLSVIYMFASGPKEFKNGVYPYISDIYFLLRQDDQKLSGRIYELEERNKIVNIELKRHEEALRGLSR